LSKLQDPLESQHDHHSAPAAQQSRRLACLRNFLRPLNTAGMEPEELLKQCRNAVPDAKIDEVVTALRQTAAEHNAEAD